jgi:iron complex transport system substrate-binding protein
MNTKTKPLALVKIAIVLCSVFLVAIPAIAAEQTAQEASANTIITASEDDYVLGVYGNANEDDTIDMGDVVYTKLAIFGKKPKTELCDAKYDGRINVLDVIQTKLIILGKEKELTFIDLDGRIVTLKKPLERIFVPFRPLLELLRAINIEPDRIVGVSLGRPQEFNELFFPEFIDKPTAGGWPIDCEAILNENPDTVLIEGSSLKSSSMNDACQDALESAGIPVIRFYAGRFGGDIVDETKKLGYIFDKHDEAEKVVDFFNKHMNPIKEKVEVIPEEDKPKVYFEGTNTNKWYARSESSAQCERAGGKNIFEGEGVGSFLIDAEAVIDRNPDFIIKAIRDVGGYHIDAGETAEFEEARVEIMSRPELQTVTAVKEGRVYVLNTHLRYTHSRCGCKGFIQTAYMAKWFHPTLFEDLDPKAIHQEYLTRFQGLDIDLDDKGVFVYHPEEYPDGS